MLEYEQRHLQLSAQPRLISETGLIWQHRKSWLNLIFRLSEDPDQKALRENHPKRLGSCQKAKRNATAPHHQVQTRIQGGNHLEVIGGIAGKIRKGVTAGDRSHLADDITTIGSRVENGAVMIRIDFGGAQPQEAEVVHPSEVVTKGEEVEIAGVTESFFCLSDSTQVINVQKSSMTCLTTFLSKDYSDDFSFSTVFCCFQKFVLL